MKSHTYVLICSGDAGLGKPTRSWQGYYAGDGINVRTRTYYYTHVVLLPATLQSLIWVGAGARPGAGGTYTLIRQLNASVATAERCSGGMAGCSIGGRSCDGPRGERPGCPFARKVPQDGFRVAMRRPAAQTLAFGRDSQGGPSERLPGGVCLKNLANSQIVDSNN